jgi:two-component system, NarL family, response regulator DevR
VCEDPAVTTPLRIFLVDDHEVVRRGVRDMLEVEDDFEVVGEAGSVEEALQRVAATRPDVAVLDVRLPDGSGVELCRELRSAYPDIVCLMLTSYDDDEALFEAIVAGASGYVLKQVKGSDIVTAIRQVGAGRSLLDPALTARVMERLRVGTTEDPRLAGLSAQERRVLDRGGDVPRREDHQELRQQPARQDGHEPADRGSGVRRPALTQLAGDVP